MEDDKEPKGAKAKKAATLSWSITLAIGFIFAALAVIGSTKATGTSVNGLIQKVRVLPVPSASPR